MAPDETTDIVFDCKKTQRINIQVNEAEIIPSQNVECVTMDRRLSFEPLFNKTMEKTLSSVKCAYEF